MELALLYTFLENTEGCPYYENVHFDSTLLNQMNHQMENLILHLILINNDVAASVVQLELGNVAKILAPLAAQYLKVAEAM